MKTNPFITVGRMAKQANPSAPPDLSPAGVRAAELSDARKNILNIGLAALGVGAGARGLVGLWNLAKRKVSPPDVKYPAALVGKMPYPVVEEDDKLADDKQAAWDSPGPDTNWWYNPAILAATGAGAIGGWKGVGALLKRRQMKDQEQEMADAQKDFEQALLDSYQQPRKLVMTPGEKLGAALDELFDAMIKESADWYDPRTWANWGNVGGRLGGIYSMYALGTGALAGGMAYNRAQKSSRRAVLEKAMKNRLRRAYESRPSEIMTVPVGICVRPPSKKDKKVEPEMLDATTRETPDDASEDISTPPRMRRHVDLSLA